MKFNQLWSSVVIHQWQVFLENKNIHAVPLQNNTLSGSGVGMPHMSPRIASPRRTDTGAGAGGFGGGGGRGGGGRGRGRGGRGQRDMGLIGELFHLCLYKVVVKITKVK